MQQRMNSATATANRAALERLHKEAHARCMHLELETDGVVTGDVFTGYLNLQVCQEREAGTLVVCEQKIGAADSQLGRAACWLTTQLAELHPLV